MNGAADMPGAKACPAPAAAVLASATSWQSALIWFGLLMAAMLVALRSTLADLIATWWHTTTYNHGFLIAPIALWLIWRRRDDLRALEPRQQPLALLPLFGLAGIWLVGAAASVVTLQEIALVAMADTLVLFCFGWQVVRRILFSLLFLFFMVPIGDFLIPPLQVLTGDLSVALLRLVGVPVFHEGNIIEVPSGTFLVAEACAGLRFLIANIVIATLFAHLAYRRWWKWLLFMVIAVAVPILANGVRAFGIVYLANLTNNELAAGADHIIYGWGFFSLIMLILLAIGHSFRDGDKVTVALPATEARHDHSSAGRPATWKKPLYLAFAAVGILWAPAYAWALFPQPSDPAHPPEFPPFNAAWSATDSAASDWRPRFVGADGELFATYERAGEHVALFIAYYDHQRQGAEVVYYANSMADGARWQLTGTGIARLSIAGDRPRDARVDYLTSMSGKRVVVWWYWVGNRLTADPIEAKIYEVVARLLHQQQAAAVLAVSVGYDTDPARALDVAQRFLNASAPVDAYLSAIGGP